MKTRKPKLSDEATEYLKDWWGLTLDEVAKDRTAMREIRSNAEEGYKLDREILAVLNRLATAGPPFLK